jgi:hypothetical protein
MIMGHRSSQFTCEEIVRPAGSHIESILVLLLSLIVVAVAGSVIVLRGTASTASAAQPWSVDAFTELLPAELAVFNALETAVPELEMIHEDDGWPTVAGLASELVPPFVQDGAWERNGRFDWERSVISTSERHIVCYIGRPGVEGMRTFLLVMLHEHGANHFMEEKHSPYEIWVHADPAVSIPNMVADNALVVGGWREVMARSGSDLVLNSKGAEFIQ